MNNDEPKEVAASVSEADSKGYAPAVKAQLEAEERMNRQIRVWEANANWKLSAGLS